MACVRAFGIVRGYSGHLGGTVDTRASFELERRGQHPDFAPGGDPSVTFFRLVVIDAFLSPREHWAKLLLVQGVAHGFGFHGCCPGSGLLTAFLGPTVVGAFLSHGLR